MAYGEYSGPVRMIWALGDPVQNMDPERYEYRHYGIGEAQVPDLVRILDEMEEFDKEFEPIAWVPLHAWRALAQIAPALAVDPLLAYVDKVDDPDDSAFDEIPVVFGVAGVEALPGIVERMNRADRKPVRMLVWTRALVEMARRHRDLRGRCVEALTAQLERMDENEPAVNSDLILSLVELEAIEAEDIIERAYRSGRILDLGLGPWEYNRARLRGEDSPQPVGFIYEFSTGGSATSTMNRAKRSAKAKSKAKRKQERASRKINRHHR